MFRCFKKYSQPFKYKQDYNFDFFLQFYKISSYR